MTGATPPSGSDFDLADIWKTLLRSRFWILGSALLCGAIAAVLAVAMPPSFTAETVLLVSSADESNSMQGLASMASRVGLGSLGLVADSAADRKVEAIATLQSRVLTEKYISENNLMPILFLSKWDVQNGKWKDADPSKWPTAWDATEMFRKRIRALAEDRRTGLVTLSIRWKDRVLAAKWANGLVNEANSYLQQSALERSTRNLEYLKAELIKGNTIEIQQSVNNLIEAEINRGVMARGNEQYAFRIIDPAVVPQESQWKRQVMLVFSGLVLGAGAAGLLALFFNALRGWRSPD